MSVRDVVLLIVGAVIGVTLFLVLVAAAEWIEERGRGRGGRWR